MRNKLEEKMQSLPKPNLSAEKKERIHQEIMNTDIDGKRSVGFMNHLKRLTVLTAGVAVIVLFSFILLTGNEGESPRSTAPGTEEGYESYAAYLAEIKVHHQIDPATAYVGNNGSLGKMHGQVLPGSYYADGMELETSEEPFGINMYYEVTEETSAEGFEKEAFHISNLPWTLLYNATAYFTFFQNGEFVHFHIDYYGEEQSYIILRKQMEELYGMDVRELSDDEELWQEVVIKNVLKDETKVREFNETITSYSSDSGTHSGN